MCERELQKEESINEEVKKNNLQNDFYDSAMVELCAEVEKQL